MKVLILATLSLAFSVVCLFFVFPGNEYYTLVRESAPNFDLSSPYAARWQMFVDRLKMESFLGRIFSVYAKKGFSTLFVEHKGDKLLIRAPTRDLFYDLYSYVSVYKGSAVEIVTKSVRTTMRVIASSEEADFGNIVVFYQPSFALVDIETIENVSDDTNVIKVEVVDQAFLESLMNVAERGTYVVVIAPKELFSRIRAFCQALGYGEIPAEFVLRGVNESVGTDL